jgi:hypothetical protein
MDPFSSPQQLAKARLVYYSRSDRETDRNDEWKEQQESLPFEVKVLQALHELRLNDPERTKMVAKWIGEAAIPNLPVNLASAAELLAFCKNPDAARSLVANADLFERTAHISSFRKATLSLALNDRAMALEFLKQSWQAGEPELVWIAVDPRFDPIHGEDDYQAICQAVFRTGPLGSSAPSRSINSDVSAHRKLTPHSLFLTQKQWQPGNGESPSFGMRRATASKNRLIG